MTASAASAQDAMNAKARKNRNRISARAKREIADFGRERYQVCSGTATRPCTCHHHAIMTLIHLALETKPCLPSQMPPCAKGDVTVLLQAAWRVEQLGLPASASNLSRRVFDRGQDVASVNISEEGNLVFAGAQHHTYTTGIK